MRRRAGIASSPTSFFSDEVVRNTPSRNALALCSSILGKCRGIYARNSLLRTTFFLDNLSVGVGHEDTPDPR